jgi:hypothetical protein
MSLKGMIWGDAGLQIRARIFDNGHYVTSATVPDRGQRDVKIIVKKKEMLDFMGEDTKIAFLVDPEAPCHYFGNVQERDYDIRNSAQLTDLLEVYPDIVYELNEKYKEIDRLRKIKNDPNVINAEFTETPEKKEEAAAKEESAGIDLNKNPVLESLTDPGPETVKKPEEEDERSTGEILIDKTKSSLRAANLMLSIRNAHDAEKNRQIGDLLEWCVDHPNFLFPLARRMKLEPEVHALCCQQEYDGAGIMPMYYVKQTAAEISEKILARPKVADGIPWALLIFGIVIVVCMIILYLIISHH